MNADANSEMVDRVVAVTGATGKLGPVAARRFAEAGARLALLARDQGEVDAVASDLPGGLERHLGIAVDLGDWEATLGAAATVRERLGPASVLLNVVGGYVGGTPFVDTTDDEWRGQIELNLMTTVHAVRAFLPDISQAELGRVITMSTYVAATPTPKHAAYAATKAAVEALTISVGRDLAGTTATSNVIVIRSIGDAKPTDTRPEEIAAAMLWLCSREASAVNGQRIPLIGRA